MYCAGVAVVVVEGEAACSVSVTGMEAPGRPMVVSRTWHVMGGFASAMDCAWACVRACAGAGAVDAGARCAAMAERRYGGVLMY